MSDYWQECCYVTPPLWVVLPSSKVVAPTHCCHCQWPFVHLVWFLFSRELLECLTSADLSNEAFPFSTHKVINVAGHDVRALRITFVGELGWELHIPSDSCVRVYEAIVEAGKRFGIVNGGYRALDSLSAEKGYKHWHQDLRHDDTPLEAGLGFTCKLKSDTPFLGREALERQKAEGLRKRLVCFTIEEYVTKFILMY